MFVEGIYDLLIDLKQYPYLESRREYVHTMTIMEITEYLSTIDADEPIAISKIKHKLSIIGAMGYSEDGGFPIISDGNTLEGYIATSEISHGIEQLEKTLSISMTETEIDKVPCYFNRVTNVDYSLNHDLKTPVRNLLADGQENLEATIPKQSMNDFSQYIDHVNITLGFVCNMLFICYLGTFNNQSKCFHDIAYGHVY